MKKWNINLIAITTFLVSVSANVKAETPDKGKTPTLWNKITPDFMKSQFAGSIGAVSVGAGWNYGKNRWETDLLIGLVPRNADRHAMVTLTLKQNYLPWKIGLGKDFMFEPLNCGLFLNTLLDNDFWVKNPDKYPEGYYTFSTKVRIHVFLGERITFKLKNQNQFVKSVSLFYELSTSDLYLINAIDNKYLTPSDYLSLAIGVKVQIH